MQKTKIEWCTHTSNPVRGKCLHACPFCYAERIRKRFGQPAKLSWHPEELAQIEKRKNPAVIFMGSTHDIFGEWVNSEWISRILDTAKNCPQHTFLFLTINPERYLDFEFPENCYVGKTLIHPVFSLFKIKTNLPTTNRFISFEPLLGEFNNDIYRNTPINEQLPHNGTVIIGSMTGPGAVKPERKWVDVLIEAADRNGCRVFLKNNLLSLFPDLPNRQETAWKEVT